MSKTSKNDKKYVMIIIANQAFIILHTSKITAEVLLAPQNRGRFSKTSFPKTQQNEK